MEEPSAALNGDQRTKARVLCEAVRVTLKQQSEGWKSRPMFQRHWVLRDFKKTAGMPMEEWLEQLHRLDERLCGDGPASASPLVKLAAYYTHLAELAKGYEKDSAKLEENLRQVYAWRDEVTSLQAVL